MTAKTFFAFNWGHKLTTQRTSSPSPSVNSGVNSLIEQGLEVQLQAAHGCLQAVELPALLLAPGCPLQARLVLRLEVAVELVAPAELGQAGGVRAGEALGHVAQDAVRQPLRARRGLGARVGRGEQQRQPPEKL